MNGDPLRPAAYNCRTFRRLTWSCEVVVSIASSYRRQDSRRVDPGCFGRSHRSARRPSDAYLLHAAVVVLMVMAQDDYVLIVFLAEYTSRGGAASRFEQHTFLLPVPFLQV